MPDPTTTQPARAWTAALTAEDCETIFHAALGAGDAKGVDAALRLLTTKDPRRAQTLYDATRTALAIALAPADAVAQLRAEADRIEQLAGGAR